MGILTLGIDTSCYTTSFALADAECNIVSEARRLLPVAEGVCGLRQSDAVFQHMLRLPELFRQLLSDIDRTENSIGAVCVSSRPRDVDGSYMPVFIAGVTFARAVADSLGAPLYETSHQAGHLMAATTISGHSFCERFLAIHLSGGTSELLSVDPDTFECSLLGGTIDSSAGQTVDRTGVAMGLSFPAGKELEKLALLCADSDISSVPTAVKGLNVSFAGPGSELMRRIDRGEPPEKVAMEVYSLIARTLVKWLKNAGDATGIKNAVLLCGVASSELLRKMIAERVRKVYNFDIDISYADPALASDNACGVAAVGALRLKRGGKGI